MFIATPVSHPTRVAPHGEQPKGVAEPIARADRELKAFRRGLLCAFCRAIVTGREEAIAINGAWNHSFVNPHGVVYHIVCYASAPGCQADGEPTLEWTWFPGFQWQVSLCRACGSHLGWYYTSGYDQAFYGLITDRLLDADQVSGTSS
jgi:hypothetical protein